MFWDRFVLFHVQFTHSLFIYAIMVAILRPTFVPIRIRLIQSYMLHVNKSHVLGLYIWYGIYGIMMSKADGLM